MKKILSFGEIIWDVYEKKALIGGAALNFSAHASRCGQETYLFSAVGQDELGREAIAIINKFGVRTDFIKHSDKETGRCLVSLDKNGVPSYHVVQDVAYDHITVSDHDIIAIREMAPDALYFGTLIQRSATSRAALHKLCREYSFGEIICDINLRKDCYDRSSVEFCLSHATILKVSEEEEPLLRDIDGYVCNPSSHLSIAEAICENHPQIQHILLTCGAQGCFVYSSQTKTHFYEKAESVRVASTVGAGDSFTAAFTASYLSGKPVSEAVRSGVALSGFVVSRTEAIPDYTVEDGRIKPKYPLLQAHRGVAAEYPENTMSAFLAAVKQGYDYIELDPGYTADHQIVVLHDSTVNRTARNKDGTNIDREIRIHDITYEEALQYDYGTGFSLKFRGEILPKLHDVLRLAHENGIRIKIDNKVQGFPVEASEALYALVGEFEEAVALTSDNAEMIEFYAKKFPRAELHYDGAVDEAVLSRLAPLGTRLTVWLPYRSPRTSWVKVPFASEEFCALVKRYAKLGIWIVEDYEAYEYICEKYSPDIIETTGVIKPEKGNGQFFDMHVHSRNSHDSITPVAECAESCVKKGISGFAVTDHFDVEYHHERDILGYIDGSVSEAEAAAKDYVGKVKILKGVEIGEGIWCEDYVREFLKRHDFDVVLSSVHAVRYKNLQEPYSVIDFSTMSDENLDGYLRLYFDEIYTMLERIPCDIVSHLTCPLRYINGKYKRAVDITKYEKQIDKILRLIIDQSLALEVNTSCDAFFMPDEWIIGKYREMGGYLVTIGSDAHVSKNVGKSFEKAIDILRKFGFKNYYYYENRIGIQCKI